MQSKINELSNLVESQKSVIESLRFAASAEEKGYVKVKTGALHMVLNALERDAQEGKVSRAEMRDELIKSMKG